MPAQTLLDVLAGRKKSGRITGEISLNGHPIDPISFTRVSGYVEQLDVFNQSSMYHVADVIAIM